MPAPTLVSYVETVWNTTGANKSLPTTSWLTGDKIVIGTLTEDATCVVSIANQFGLTFTSTTVGTAGSTCFAGIWRATATSDQTSVAVAATSADGGPNSHMWGLGLWVFRNHGDTGTPTTDITTAKTHNLTRAVANSLVVGLQGDFSAASSAGYSFTPALSGGNDRQHAALTNYTIYVADWGDQGATGTTAYGTTGETSTGTFAKILIEVKGVPAAGGIPSAQPGKTWERRYKHRQQLPIGLAGAAPAAAPAFVPPVNRSELRGLRARRGRMVIPVSPPVVIPAPSPRLRIRGVPSRRSEAVAPVPVQPVVPAAPTFLQDPGRHDLRGWLQRRSRTAAVSAPQTAPPPLIRQRRTFAGLRRARIVTPVSAQQAAPTPPPYPVWTFRVRRTLTGLRRAKTAEPIPAQQAAPTAPPYVPQLKAARRVQAAPRRGRATVPTSVVHRVPIAITRRRFTLPGKRRQLTTPVPPQIVVVPPTYPKQPVRRRIVALLLRRPGRQRAPVPPQVGPPPIIDANGRVVVTQTVVSSVDAGGMSGLVGVDQTVASAVSGSSAASGGVSIDPTADGRAEVG